MRLKNIFDPKRNRHQSAKLIKIIGSLNCIINYWAEWQKNNLESRKDDMIIAKVKKVLLKPRRGEIILSPLRGFQSREFIFLFFSYSPPVLGGVPGGGGGSYL
jgi:hypothetical protein